MNIGLDFRQGLNRLPDVLEAMVARINTVWLKEHKEDGGHGDITADSIAVKNNATVGGTSEFDNLVVKGTSDQQGPVTMRSTLVVNGHTSLLSVGVTNNAAIGGTLGVTGASTFVGLLTAAPGGVSTSALLNSGHTQLQSTLSVVGAANFDKTVSVAGVLTASPGGISATSVSAGSANITNITVPGLTFTGTLDVFSTSQHRDGMFEYLRATKMGDWITVPFSAGNYSAGGSMAWTVGAAGTSTKYTLVGHTMHLAFSASGTCSGTASIELRIVIPGGYLASGVGGQSYGNVSAWAGGLGMTGLVTAGGGGGASSTFISLFKNDFTTWPTGVAFNVAGSINIHIV